MTSKRHFVFNIALILLPWFSILFLGKQNVKRFSLAGLVVVLCEVITQIIGHKRKWWVFYDRSDSFIRDLLPFSAGPYLPMSL
ncbi:hypothetical protein [Salirhabdus sp. Marseille-P4669]|uniref:hypothetical protein n=1 Tax=Salirhabdus sp. Marseille-P4669 TaxID=2042310 RepID=UPI0027954E9D|nr:hypothetical protein [Salirhabdus sp. Marseille-P4669]